MSSTPPPLPRQPLLPEDPPPPIPPGSQWSDAADASSPRHKRFWLWVLGASLGCFGLILGAGLLALHYAPRLIETWTSGSHFAVEADLRELRAALQAWAAQHGGQYPATLDELCTPDRDGHALLERIPRDPWDRAYRYEKSTGEHARPRLSTLGADGQPGGLGENADVDSEHLRETR